MSDGRTLFTIVRQAADQMGTATILAEQVGMSLSAMMRGAKNRQLSADTLLRIAEVIGEDPSVVLRAAGKGETAERIERLYGKPRPPLSETDRTLIDLEPDVKRQLIRLIHGLTK